jgi:hypothetical protein
MFSRADRREWAVLGLVALGWCLLVAPALHRETHAEGRKHSHGVPSQQQQRNHGEGSFEHQLAVFVAPASAPSVFGEFTALALLQVDAPESPFAAPQRSVAQGQAP